MNTLFEWCKRHWVWLALGFGAWWYWRRPARLERPPGQNPGGTATAAELSYTEYKTGGGTLDFKEWYETVYPGK